MAIAGILINGVRGEEWRRMKRTLKRVVKCAPMNTEVCLVLQSRFGGSDDWECLILPFPPPPAKESSAEIRPTATDDSVCCFWWSIHWLTTSTVHSVLTGSWPGEGERSPRERGRTPKKTKREREREIKDVNIEGIAILCFTFHSKVNVVAVSDAGAEAAAAAPKGEP